MILTRRVSFVSQTARPAMISSTAGTCLWRELEERFSSSWATRARSPLSRMPICVGRNSRIQSRSSSIGTIEPRTFGSASICRVAFAAKTVVALQL